MTARIVQRLAVIGAVLSIPTAHFIVMAGGAGMVHKDYIPVLVHRKGIVAGTFLAIHIPGGQQRIGVFGPVGRIQKICTIFGLQHADGILRARAGSRIAKENISVMLQHRGAFVDTIAHTFPTVVGTGQTDLLRSQSPRGAFVNGGNEQVCTAALVGSRGFTSPANVGYPTGLILKVGHIQIERLIEGVDAAFGIRHHLIVLPLGYLIGSGQRRFVGVQIAVENQGMRVDIEHIVPVMALGKIHHPVITDAVNFRRPDIAAAGILLRAVVVKSLVAGFPDGHLLAAVLEPFQRLGLSQYNAVILLEIVIAVNLVALLREIGAGHIIVAGLLIPENAGVCHAFNELGLIIVHRTGGRVVIVGEIGIPIIRVILGQRAAVEFFQIVEVLGLNHLGCNLHRGAVCQLHALQGIGPVQVELLGGAIGIGGGDSGILLCQQCLRQLSGCGLQNVQRFHAVVLYGAQLVANGVVLCLCNLQGIAQGNPAVLLQKVLSIQHQRKVTLLEPCGRILRRGHQRIVIIVDAILRSKHMVSLGRIRIAGYHHEFAVPILENPGFCNTQRAVGVLGENNTAAVVQHLKILAVTADRQINALGLLLNIPGRRIEICRGGIYRHIITRLQSLRKVLAAGILPQSVDLCIRQCRAVEGNIVQQCVGTVPIGRHAGTQADIGIHGVTVSAVAHQIVDHLHIVLSARLNRMGHLDTIAIEGNSLRRDNHRHHFPAGIGGPSDAAGIEIGIRAVLIGGIPVNHALVDRECTSASSRCGGHLKVDETIGAAGVVQRIGPEIQRQAAAHIGTGKGIVGQLRKGTVVVIGGIQAQDLSALRILHQSRRCTIAHRLEGNVALSVRQPRSLRSKVRKVKGGRLHSGKLCRTVVGFHHPLVLLRCDADGGAVTGTGRHFVIRIRRVENTAFQIICHQRIVTSAAEVIHQQAVSAVRLVVLIEFENRGTLHPLIAVEGIRGNMGPGTQQSIRLFNKNGLGICAKLIGIAALIFRIAVVGTVLIENGSVDAGFIQVNVHLRLRKGIEVAGLGVIQPLLSVVVIGHLGGPIDNILTSPIIIGGLRRPGAACIDAGTDRNHPLVGPVNQIGGFPYHQGLAAVGLSSAPIAIAINFQVGGDHVEFVAFGGPNDKGITHTLFTHGCSENGLIVIEVRPVQAVLAGCKEDLLAVGVAFTGKVGEEIVGIIRIIDGFRGCFYSKDKVLRCSLAMDLHRSGHCHLRIFYRTGNDAGRHVVIVRNRRHVHIDDFRMVGAPGDRPPAGGAGFRQCDVAPYIILIGDVNGCQRLRQCILYNQSLDHNRQTFIILHTIDGKGYRDGNCGIRIGNAMHRAVLFQNVRLDPIAPSNLGIAHLGGESQIFRNLLQRGVMSQHGCRNLLQHQVAHGICRVGQARFHLLRTERFVIDFHIQHIRCQFVVRRIEGAAQIAQHFSVRNDIRNAVGMFQRGDRLTIQIGCDCLVLADHRNGMVTIAPTSIGDAATNFITLGGTYLDSRKHLAAKTALVGFGADKQIVTHVILVPGTNAVADDPGPLGGVGVLHRHGNFHGTVIVRCRNQSLRQRGVLLVCKSQYILPLIDEKVLFRCVIQCRVVFIARYIQQLVAAVGHIIVRSCIRQFYACQSYGTGCVGKWNQRNSHYCCQCSGNWSLPSYSHDASSSFSPDGSQNSSKVFLRL